MIENNPDLYLFEVPAIGKYCYNSWEWEDERGAKRRFSVCSITWAFNVILAIEFELEDPPIIKELES